MPIFLGNMCQRGLPLAQLGSSAHACDGEVGLSAPPGHLATSENGGPSLNSMESAPHREERLSCDTCVLLEVGERHTGQAEAAMHFRDQPDYTCAHFFFDGLWT